MGNPSIPSSALQNSLLNNFNYLDDLRDEFLNTADAMFGPGFVWLVRARLPQRGATRSGEWAWRILTTYLAGTPYAQAHARRQATDMNTAANTMESVKASAAAGMSRLDFQRTYQQPTNSVGSFGSAYQSEADKIARAGGVEVVPCLCVSTWEHVWLRDYGIGGKAAYLGRFWDCVDWEKVEERSKATDTQASKQSMMIRSVMSSVS